VDFSPVSVFHETEERHVTADYTFGTLPSIKHGFRANRIRGDSVAVSAIAAARTHF
jgi:hypothetical protein